MYALYNTVPNYCCSCGKVINLDTYSIQDFYGGVSFSCECGCTYQYLNEDVMEEKLAGCLDGLYFK